ncbi:cytochrome P450 4A10 [Melanomma pulvis-pyrius CBS 109.77]|uniref:Cytochrome P450 4A10 n=1 Tax=Melanomma pulvis-pyrius CBS 109.77 TaxID=1314802 RepID=A0A6A6XPW4_9PLEO|nr:cytochrome P450 4A10 [Melanomma pulvis-pyrius CBS 109.77]
MTLLDQSFSALSVHHVASITFLLIVVLLVRPLYFLFLHPLSHIPGPILAKLSPLWLYYHSYIGDEATVIHALHQRHGPYVRVSPHEIDIADPDAVQPIYIAKGGFAKAKCYNNFTIDGHATIFSTTSNEVRASRAKAVTPLFSTKSIRENDAALYACVDRMVARLERESKTGTQTVNLLNLTRSLAVDMVSTHLFQQDYNSVSEAGPVLSISLFVDAFVGVGRFFYLPNLVFVWVDWAITTFSPDHGTSKSMATVDVFVDDMVENTSEKSTSYAGRMLAAGILKDEVKAQCKDLVFAGTDSTGMNLAMICRFLVLHPKQYARLREEVQSNTSQDPSSLPYLSATVKEVLRLSMANPTRLPRVVPPSGWAFKNRVFPAGTIVGCSAYALHLDSTIFPNPHAFEPERWLEGNATLEMQKSWFAFGAGSRACIARNLAMTELLMAAQRIAMSGVLEGARCVQDEVQLYEWFNSRVKGEIVEVVWE